MNSLVRRIKRLEERSGAKEPRVIVITSVIEKDKQRQSVLGRDCPWNPSYRRARRAVH
jgi:hypothetical protein